ncbi:MAG TPA: AraC family transcriptional regulator ligand-binding domain-containing protein [Alcanivorax sp.]|nr:AraC family transcriptional regulator ligand-binding domain-containing protein [Alcanivorax sp.]
MVGHLLARILRGRLDQHAPFEDRFISLAQLDGLLGTAFARAEDPLVGLRVGRDNHYRDLGPFGHLMAASDTLEQALSVLLHYRALMLPYLALELRREEHHCALTVGGGETLAVTRTRAHNELLVAALAALGRSLLGGHMPIQRVAFRHACPSDDELAEYRSFFRCALEFGQPVNALVFSPALLGQSLPGCDAARRQQLAQAADQRLLALRRAGGVTGQVTEQLRDGLGRGPLTVQVVADRLDMTARTLQRRLRDEGVQFARLRDQVRMEYACRRLRDGDCGMPELARRLGFSDTANFYHAFRRWTGCAPGAYRRQQAPLT